MNKLFGACIITVLGLLLMAGMASATPGIGLAVNGQPYGPASGLMLAGNTALLPVPILADILSAEINTGIAAGEEQPVTLALNGQTITIQPGQVEAVANGSKVTLPVAPQATANGVLAPLRAVCEALGAKVAWDGAIHTISITVPPNEQAVSALAEQAVQDLANKDYAAVAKGFDPAMTAACPQDKLQGIWEMVQQQAGAYQSIESVRSEVYQQYIIVYVTCQFEQAALDVKLVFNPLQQISGLFFVPAQSAPVAYQAPAYVNPASFTETGVTVGSGEWALPGTLTVPVGQGPFPAVVLVQGSGPSDRDESVGPNKPFRDLAWGLASRGIAVLRYEKRTKEYTARMAAILGQITVKEETVDDALAAAALLRQTKGIDTSRIFVLGHSLGGYLAPRIGLGDPGIAGLIVMAGPTRPLEDLVLDQETYLASLGQIDQAQLAAVKQQVAQVKALQPDDAAKAPPVTLLDLTATYWLDLKGYSPPAVAAKLPQPMLILQGARDYQVSPQDDFQGWKSGLAQKSNAAFKLYDDLNHLFMTGHGKSTPSEYATPGHVAGSVVSDIAAWVGQH
ncbi:MAG: alpha/beta fold hydrolase [Thermacetogeniaceae bacterium]